MYLLALPSSTSFEVKSVKFATRVALAFRRLSRQAALQGRTLMMRHSIAASVLVLLFAANLFAADKEVKGTVVKVDLKKSTITVKTDDGEKTYDINDDTKFLGPKGGVSKEGIKDDRLAPGAEVKLVIAGNNKTAREVHLPERKEKDK
jgi:hypothetical protein